MNGSFSSTGMYLTSPESTFCPLFFYFEKNGDLEKSAFIWQTKQILNILHKYHL